MAKYSFEKKMEVVQAYLDREGGYNTLAKRFGVPNKSIIQEWVKSYQIKGVEGLLRSRQHLEYTFEFKLSVVESYLIEEISYQDLALRCGVRNASTIVRWVNAYRQKGSEGLKPKPKGRSPSMPRSKKPPKTTKPSNSQPQQDERLQELEQGNLYLRIENAYLKELRRVRLEEARVTKKSQELSTSSEENSD